MELSVYFGIVISALVLLVTITSVWLQKAKKTLHSMLTVFLICIFVSGIIIIIITTASYVSQLKPVSPTTPGKDIQSSNATSVISTERPQNTNMPGLVTDVNVVLEHADEIKSVIEKSFSSLGFEEGSITTEKGPCDTSTMSAEIYGFYIGSSAYLWQDLNSGQYTTLFVPIHFSMHINQTLTFEEQTIDDVVGYAWITLSEVDKHGELQYKITNYLTAQYFTSEELLYDHLCGHGYIVEEIPLSH